MQARDPPLQGGVDCGDAKAEAPVVRLECYCTGDPRSDPIAEGKGERGCNGQRASGRDTQS
jgi:hypothetical protein